MIHFSCDCCKRPLDPKQDLRYVVRMEVYAAVENAEEDCDSDRDHLQEIQDLLECLDDADDDQLAGNVYQQLRFDLCSDCRSRFLRDPVGRPMAAQLGFSEN